LALRFSTVVDDEMAVSVSHPQNGGGTSLLSVLSSVLGGASRCEPASAGRVLSLGHNVGITRSCGSHATDRWGTDPLLGSQADNGGPTLSHDLRAGSPAIDAGDPAGCPRTDQRGAARPVGSACDAGAVEALGEAPAVDPGPVPDFPHVPVFDRRTRPRGGLACGWPGTGDEGGLDRAAKPPVRPASPITPVVCPTLRGRVPDGALARALEEPESVPGWRLLRDPGKPAGPANPMRTHLNLMNPSIPYHPTFNGLEFDAGCR
jgi:hypothetical protein